MLQFITHSTDSRDTLQGARAAIEGGCKWVQLRMKDATDDEVLETGKALGELCREKAVTFIIDDRVHLVSPLGADGVHLGKNDMPVSEARAILGHDKIIGTTANTVDDVFGAVDQGADYIGLGPFRFTTTKKKLSPVLGLEGLVNVMTKLREVSDIPVVAIGGITEDDIEDIMKTGVTGVALSGVILNAADPVGMTRSIQCTIHDAQCAIHNL
ncbi:MAG: thiamine phosphate synthase [Muribaculaceae bacterium]|nr:thiamine phosphate synthase [Muribaculaceae bacterium]